MTQTASPAGTTQSRTDLLGVYLNDHLAGSTTGLELFRRAARAQRGTPYGDVLERLVVEVAEDREALIDIMQSLGIPVRRYKIYLGWALEKAGRLKLNGRVLGRSPLSTLVELEALVLGVTGKAAGWKALRVAAGRDARLDPGRLGRLLDRARGQLDTLEELRTRAAAELFGPAGSGPR